MTDLSELKTLEFLLKEGDYKIVDIKNNLDKIIASSSIADDFEKTMFFYIEFEKLISIRLDQLNLFIDDTDNLENQTSTLLCIRNKIISEIKEYEHIVATNNNLSVQVSLLFENVENRLDNLFEISKNIKNVVTEFMELVREKRNNIQFANNSTFLIPLKFINIVSLTDTIYIDLNEYMMLQSQYTYKIFIDHYKNIELNKNILQIKRSGNVRKYYVIIHVSDDQFNYNFITIPVSETSIEITIQLKNELYMLKFSDYLYDVTKYEYVFANNPYKNAYIVDNTLYIQGKYGDNRYDIDIDIVDENEKLTFKIIVFEYTVAPSINKTFNDNNPLVLVNSMYIYDMNDYISHPYLDMIFVIEESIPNNVILESNTGILKILFSNKDIEYTINIKAITVDASSLNNFSILLIDFDHFTHHEKSNIHSNRVNVNHNRSN